jgi:hypothetical protein
MRLATISANITVFWAAIVQNLIASYYLHYNVGLINGPKDVVNVKALYWIGPVSRRTGAGHSEECA